MIAVEVFCLLSLLLVVGKVLRVCIPLLQKLYLPSSVIGGVAGLIVIQLFPGLVDRELVAVAGKIPGFLVSGKVNTDRAKDVPGFIAYMFPRLIFFSIAVTVFCVVSLIGDLYDISPYITVISVVFYIAILIYYCIVSVKAQNRFLF